jgi:hypothetical protein
LVKMWTEEQREALEEFYREHDASKLDNIEKILESFSPGELEASLERKYGCSPSFQDEDGEEVAALDLPQEHISARRPTNAHGTPFESDSIYETIKTLSCVGSAFSIFVGSLNFIACVALSASVSRLDGRVGLVIMGYFQAILALLWGLFGVYVLCNNSKKLIQIETILEAKEQQDPNLFHKLQEYLDDTTHYESESEALSEAYVSFAEKIKKDTKRATLVGTVGQAILFAFFALLVIMVSKSIQPCAEGCVHIMNFVVLYHGVIVLVVALGFTYIGFSLYGCLTAALDNGLVDAFPVRVTQITAIPTATATKVGAALAALAAVYCIVVGAFAGGAELSALTVAAIAVLAIITAFAVFKTFASDNGHFEPYSEAIAAAEAAAAVEAAAGGSAVTTLPRTVAGSTSGHSVALATMSGSAVVI